MNVESMDRPLIPARMLNEFTYCPRLMYLEWVQGNWRDNLETIQGRIVHQRVDTSPPHSAPEPDTEWREVWEVRSLMLSSERLGIIAKMDFIEGDRGTVSPIDYKRGKTPPGNVGGWDADRVQVCAQALILRDNGYQVDMAYLYYAASHERVGVIIDEQLVATTLAQIEGVRCATNQDVAPPPLVDSPKCPRCSLVSICLPDETHRLLGAEDRPVRRLIPAATLRFPVYFTQSGTSVGKSGERLVLKEKGIAIQEVRLIEVDHVALFGNIQISSQAVQTLCDLNIPITYFSHGGWFYGTTHGLDHKNVLLRQQQYRAAENANQSLAIASAIIRGKIANSRTLLRRNGNNVPKSVLDRLASSIRSAAHARSLSELLGVEGAAADLYFEHLPRMLKVDSFQWRHRNRRPPTDPVNALLSLGYALLAKQCTVLAQSVGFDPYLGFYHQPRYGRPSLALDLMEEFRPLIVDSIVITTINTGEITVDDFIQRGPAVALSPAARRTFIAAFERRINTEVQHPIFKYKLSYRRTLEVQARLLGRYLTSELPAYVPFRTR